MSGDRGKERRQGKVVEAGKRQGGRGEERRQGRGSRGKREEKEWKQ